MKANKKVAEHKCGRCGEQLAFGEDVVICVPCKRGYHASCWDDAGGCAQEGCENAALAQIEDPAPAAKKEIPLGSKECPHCGKVIRSNVKICRYCKKVPTPDGVYRGPKSPAPGSTAALVYGILSIFVCGLIFGLLAVNKANEAEKAIARDPSLTGQGNATAGKVIGIIGIVLWALVLFLRVAAVR
jgi:hypothetical protein